MDREVLLLVGTGAANVVYWHLRIQWLTGAIDWNLLRWRLLLLLLLLVLVLLLLRVSFLHVYGDFMVRRETSGCEDLGGGMAIVIRLKGVAPETGIVEGAAGTGKLDTLIQHFLEADGYLVDDVLLPGLFLFQ